MNGTRVQLKSEKYVMRPPILESIPILKKKEMCPFTCLLGYYTVRKM